MAHDNGGSALAVDGVRQGGYIRAKSAKSQGQHRTWRGALALGFLFVSTVAGYGLIFVLIDKWYKGGSLGLL